MQVSTFNNSTAEKRNEESKRPDHRNQAVMTTMADQQQQQQQGIDQAEKLPPGFRFHPTDEELITFYLLNKIADSNFAARAVTDVDLNKFEPWELPGKAKMGEKEWYFFSQRDRKYPTGVRTNRATNTGYWKTTGKDKEIFNSNSSESESDIQLIGMKKTLVFYKGRAPRGEKTNWVMHEYRVSSKPQTFRTPKEEWVVCRVFQKSIGAKKYPPNQSRAPNAYVNLEMASSIMQMPDSGSTHQYPYGRNFITGPDLADLNRVFRTGVVGGSAHSINLPMQPQFNYPHIGGGGGAGCFTISGLNLNLGGATTSQPVLQRSMPPPPVVLASTSIGGHQEVAPSMIASTVAPEPGYGAAVNMDHCMELENYWSNY